MDKKFLLDRCAKGGEERMFLAHVLDKYEQCTARNIPTCTGFLSPAEQRSALDLLHAAAVHEGFALVGGYEGAERKMLRFLPQWQETADEAELMTALRCTFYEAGSLTHRDFLGSLMGLQITREKIGDILVQDESADLLVSADIEPYLLQNWRSAGRVKLRVSQVALSDLAVPEQKIKEIHDTVATLRLDAVVSAGLAMSRGRAQELIAAGRVQLAYRDCLKSDAPVAEGDIISARGLGKFEVARVGGQSKKGRTGITLRRYL